MIDLINRNYFSTTGYFGYIYDRNLAPVLSYELIDGFDSDDNDQFVIVGNHVYSKLQYKQNENKQIYKIRIAAKYENETIEKSFSIARYNPTNSTKPIQSVYIGNSIFISTNQNTYTLINQPNGKVEKKENGFVYTAGLTAGNDVVVYKIGGDAFALLIEVYNNKRIEEIPKNVGTYKFNQILYNENDKTWSVGNHKTNNFYVYNDSIVLGSLGNDGLLFHGLTRLQRNRIIGKHLNVVTTYLENNIISFATRRLGHSFGINNFSGNIVLVLDEYDIVIDIIPNSQIRRTFILV